MDVLLSILTDPKVLSLLSLPIICMIIEGFVIYKLYKFINELQEKRIGEWQQMQKEYTDLAQNINNTLDVLLKVIGNKRNGNGGSTDGR